MNTWDVMLIDHDRLFSAALGTLIGGGPFRVVRSSAAVSDALTLLALAPSPHLIVLALHGSEEEDGLRRLRQATTARIVALADGGHDQAQTGRLLPLALRGGADAYLEKSMSSESLLRALHLVMLGEVVYPTHIASLLIAGANERPSPVPTAARAEGAGGELSKREIQILRCLLAGQSNKAIARHLQITESTVKMHFKNVMRKINAQNRTQAAVWAIQNGLAPLASA